ncbi:MAG TPA: hypothetical protein VFB81_05825 [Myxococcales bacterium]|nr:hypothetical protein [Myxococcales bacterium]
MRAISLERRSICGASRGMSKRDPSERGAARHGASEPGAGVHGAGEPGLIHGDGAGAGGARRRSFAGKPVA